MKSIFFILLLSFSLYSYCQDTLYLKIIDSTINSDQKNVSRIIFDKWYPRDNIEILHGGGLDTVTFIYKFSSGNDLFEYSKAWVSVKDTGQITSYFFNKEKLIKVTTRTRTRNDSYIQYAYYNNGKFIYGGDSEGGTNPNALNYLRHYKKILKQAKLKSKKYRY